jgi:hypothetical protein
VRDGEKVALLRELLKRVQARADREHPALASDQSELEPRRLDGSQAGEPGGLVGPGLQPADPWTPLNADAVEVLSGRLLGLQTIPPPRPDDSGMIKRWTELLEQDPELVPRLDSRPPAAAEDVSSSTAALAPLRSDVQPEPVISLETRTLAISPGPESSATSPPGHFESSVSAAVEALDEPSLLRGAETDLRVRRSTRPILPRPRRSRSATPVEARRPPGTERPPATSPTEELAPAAEVPAAPEPEPELSLTRPRSERGDSRSAAVPEEPGLEPTFPVRRGHGRWLVALVGVGLGVVGLSTLPRDPSSPSPEGPGSKGPSALALDSRGPSPSPSPRRSQSVPESLPPISSPASASASARVEHPPLRDPASFGWLRVDVSTPGRVYVQGIDVGPTGVALEVRCGLRNVRVAQAAPPPPGSSFPAWSGESKSVVVPCGAEHHAAW